MYTAPFPIFTEKLSLSLFFFGVRFRIQNTFFWCEFCIKKEWEGGNKKKARWEMREKWEKTRFTYFYYFSCDVQKGMDTKGGYIFSSYFFSKKKKYIGNMAVGSTIF